MQGTLDGRAIIVTSAGGGIGRAASLIFAQAGGRVVVSDIDVGSGEETVRQISAQGGVQQRWHCSWPQAVARHQRG
ncbi:SDR family NAD(P)-dependent oxidoreductase [Paraburkholderia sp. NPDC080076]|uniref:SDR family NAD(P)-dependent oxidoreductase n=1 Tax=Paraburkholderia sp. NPDC080076 TaxID=3390605 RepID=UPI003D0862E8